MPDIYDVLKTQYKFNESVTREDLNRLAYFVAFFRSGVDGAVPEAEDFVLAAKTLVFLEQKIQED